MRKLFISVPMKGRTEDEIKASISKMKQIAEVFEGEELELIDSYIEHKPPANNNKAIWYLGESLKKLSEADVFITIDDMWNWNGCCVENEVASRYGIKRYVAPAEIVIPNYAKIMRDRHEAESLKTDVAPCKH